jgi:hypothetical protein
MGAVFSMKVMPAYTEYGTIVKDVSASVAQVGRDATVEELRRAFGRFAEIDRIDAITPADLEISKDSGQIVVKFAYEKRIPLFYNISLLIDFQGRAPK